jgi:tight adherence protein C
MLDQLSENLHLDLTGWTGFAVIAAIVGVATFAFLRALARHAPAEPRVGPSASDTEIDLADLERRLATERRGRDEEQIAPELRQAGYYDPRALRRFQLIRAGLMLVPLCVTAFLAVSAEAVYVPRIILWGALAVVAGFSLPRAYIGLVARARRRQIERGLPVALDLTSLALLGGQNVLGAFRQAGQAVRATYPVLAEEMGLVLKQAELKTFPMALEQWSERSGVPEVQNVSVAIGQADRLGVNVADALLELSSNFRTGLRQKADAAANRASVWMLAPTLLCLWIPAALVLISPIFFEFQERRARAAEAVRKTGNPDGTGNESLSDSYRGRLNHDRGGKGSAGSAESTTQP